MGAAGRTSLYACGRLEDETSEDAWLCGVPVVRSSRHQPLTTERPGGDDQPQGGGGKQRRSSE